MFGYRRSGPLGVIILSLFFAGLCAAAPLTLERAQQLHRTGDADRARLLLQRDGFYEQDAAQALLLVAELFYQTGAYEDAVQLVRLILSQFAEDDLEILGRCRAILRESGFPDEAADLLTRINNRATERKQNKGSFSPGELVALGKIAVESRADPVRILNQFYKPALKKDPKLLAGYLAAAELSHSNQDYKYAAEFLRDGLKKHGPHADLHFWLAFTLYESNEMRGAAEEALKALAINPNHTPTLLLNALREYATGTEDDFVAALEKVYAIDPWNQRALALETAQHHRRKRMQQVHDTRDKALQVWPQSPYVDYWIGYLLSRRLLLKEAIPYLIRATEIDPDLIEAKAQLGLAYLRRGDEKRGWALIEEVQQTDPYNVIAFNHAELKAYIDAMTTIETPHFRVRLPKKDHDLYGDRVMELLDRARTEMTQRYDHTPSELTLIEFFTNTQDINIRLSGIPGGLGVLGACFGDVISMQSAGGVGMLGQNWEHVLWHEYAHTVTLAATEQRIPRWLTEGCSVHEEALFDKRHRRPLDQRTHPIFAQGKLIPISQLNEKFRSDDMMLAYFQSGRMVDRIVEKHGYEKLRLVLKDIAKGKLVEDSFALHMEPIADFEADFAQIAKTEADSLAPDLDWQMPSNPALLKRDAGALAAYLEQNPNNYWALKQQCLVHGRNKSWDALQQTASHLLALYPTDGSDDCARYYLSLVARFKNQPAKERELLEAWLPHSGSAVYAYERLVELNTREERWPELLASGQSLFGVQPLTHLAHRGMGRAYEGLAQSDAAISAYEKLLLTDLINPADTHYRLGTLKSQTQPEAAKRHILDAISEAPRYKKAHHLLLQLHGKCSCGLQHR